MTFDEREFHLQLRGDIVWQHPLPKLGMSIFFGMLDQYTECERQWLSERLYGLATL